MGWPGLMFVHLDQGVCSPGVLHPSCSMEESADGSIPTLSVRAPFLTTISANSARCNQIHYGKGSGGNSILAQMVDGSLVPLLLASSRRHPCGGIPVFSELRILLHKIFKNFSALSGMTAGDRSAVAPTQRYAESLSARVPLGVRNNPRIPLFPLGQALRPL